MVIATDGQLLVIATAGNNWF